jgi:hypothetical protein
MLSAWAGVGCLPQQLVPPEAKPPATAVKPGPPLPVTADLVNEANARSMAGALLDELNRDAQNLKPTAGGNAAAKGKP